MSYAERLNPAEVIAAQAAEIERLRQRERYLSGMLNKCERDAQRALRRVREDPLNNQDAYMVACQAIQQRAAGIAED